MRPLANSLTENWPWLSQFLELDKK
jgi:hypothetical protein